MLFQVKVQSTLNIKLLKLLKAFSLTPVIYIFNADGNKNVY